MIIEKVKSGSSIGPDASNIFKEHISRIPKTLQKRELRFIRVERKTNMTAGCKKPHDSKWTKGHSFSYDHPSLDQWLMAKNNYGVVTGIGGLAVVDTDSCITEKIMFDAIKHGDLPDTFIVKTRGGHHFYYFLPEVHKKIVFGDIEIFPDGSYKTLPDNIRNDAESLKTFKQEHRVEHAGEIQGDGQQVVAPDSVHRSGIIYKPLNSNKIAHTTMGDLLTILGKFLPNEGEEDDGFIELFGKENKDLPKIHKFINTAEIKKKVSIGDMYQGPHIIHGSTTGSNFTVDGAANTWYCFRHNVGGGFLDFVAMKEGIIPCAAGRKKVNKELKKTDPKLYEKVLNVARKKYGLIGIEKNYSLERSKMDEYRVYKYDDDGKVVGFIPHNAARYLLKEKLPAIITLEDSMSTHYYKEGYFHKGGENKINYLVETLFKENSTTHYRREILEKIQIRSLFDRKDLGGELRYVNMNNGVFDMKTKTLLEHDLKYNFISKSPIDYDPKATCPRFRELLKQVIPDESEQKGLQEYMGYIFYRTMPFHKVFVFLGSGSNGKGTITDIISKLVGESDKTAIPIRQFKQPWARASLFGTMLNMCGEISDNKLYDTDYLKRIRGGDLLDARNLYEQPFQFRSYAKMIFSANALPPTNDSTSGFYRSFLFARFPKQFSIKTRNVNIKKGIIQNELPGVFNFAMEGLYRLLDQEQFSNEQSIDDATNFYEEHVESVRDYINERLEITGRNDDYEYTSEVYEDYCEWCLERDRAPKDKMVFSKKIMKTCQHVIIKGNPKKYYGLFMVRLSHK